MNNDLQRIWVLRGFEVPRSDMLIVQAYACDDDTAYPSPIGRSGLQVLAEPAVRKVRYNAEFSFTGVLVLRFWDSVTPYRYEDENAKFEGDTFRIYSTSPLLDEIRDHMTGITAFHYQIVLSDGSMNIDVICQHAPQIDLRDYQHTDGPPSDV